MSARAPSRSRSWAVERAPGRTTHSSPRIPSGPRSGRAAQALPSPWASSGQSGLRGCWAGVVLVGDEADAAVVGHRQALAAGRSPVAMSRASLRQTTARSAPSSSRAWAVIVSRTSRRSLRPVSWRATAYRASRSRSRRWRSATVRPSWAAPAISPAMSARAAVRDVGLDGRVECEAEVPDPVRAADQREVEDARVHAVPAAVARARRRPGRRVRRRIGVSQAEARGEGRRTLECQGLAVGRADADDAGQGPGLGHDAVQRLLQEVRQREAAANRGADRVRHRQVLVLRDQLLLGAIEVEGDDRREHDDGRRP